MIGEKPHPIKHPRLIEGKLLAIVGVSTEVRNRVAAGIELLENAQPRLISADGNALCAAAAALFPDPANRDSRR